MSLLNAEPIYKPFFYEWAYRAWKKQQQIHWLAEEVPMADDVKDWKKGIDQLVKMGFKRILSSGQQPTVSAGLGRLKEMVDYAAGRIEIMAGGGISDALVAPIIKTGVDAIHFSGTSATIIDETSLFSTTLLLPNEEKTRALVHAFQQINLD